MIVVGLTGNYGMGKSTIARMFRELGAATIDTDDIVRELLTEPALILEIKNAFGEDIVDKETVNKHMLAGIVFNYPHLRISLENILHPRVFRKVDEKVEALRSGGARLVIVEAPVIFERGYQNRFDKVVTVYTSEETAVERLKAKGVSGENALNRLKSQFPVAMKLSGSDFSIDNGDDIKKTRERVEFIYRELTALDQGEPGGPAKRNYGNN